MWVIFLYKALDSVTVSVLNDTGENGRIIFPTLILLSITHFFL